MLVTLISGNAGETDSDEVFCSVKWTAPFSREFGSARVEIPRSSPLFSSLHLNHEGGFLVYIKTLNSNITGDAPSWLGISDIPIKSENLITLNCFSINYLFTFRHVFSQRKFIGITAGEIFRNAFEESFSGFAGNPFVIGGIAESHPVVPYFEFNGQSLNEIMLELSDITGQEYSIDLSTLFRNEESPNSFAKVYWGFFYDTNIDVYHLFDEKSIFNFKKIGNISNRLNEVISIGNDGQKYTALNQKDSMWNKQQIIKVDSNSSSELQLFAENFLKIRKDTFFIYEGDVPLELNLIIGSTVFIFSPKFSEENISCRVVSKEISDNSNLQHIVFQSNGNYNEQDFTRLYQKNIQVRDTYDKSDKSCYDERSNSRLSKIVGTVGFELMIPATGEISTGLTVVFERKSDQCHAGYSIRYRKTDLASYQYLPVIKEVVENLNDEEIMGVASLKATINALSANNSYHVGVATLAKNGLFSDYSGNTNPQSTTAAASTANPMVVTSTAHGLITKDTIKITSWAVSGLKGREFLVTVLTADTFSINVNGATYGAGGLGTGTFLKTNLIVQVSASSYTPAQVTGLTADAGIKNITLKWTLLTDVFVETYKLEKSPTGAGTWSVIANIKSNRWIDSFYIGTTEGTFDYRVSAVSRFGQTGPVSGTVTATPLAVLTGVPNASIGPVLLKIDGFGGDVGHSAGGQITFSATKLLLRNNEITGAEVDGSGYVIISSRLYLVANTNGYLSWDGTAIKVQNGDFYVA